MQCSRMQDEELAGQKMEVLYGEADTATTAAVEEHLAGCGACRDEMAALGRLRRDLAAWTVEPGRISGPVAVAPKRPLPLWLSAAAALLLGLGVGLALMGYVSLRRDLAAQEARALERERHYQEEIAVLQARLAERTAAIDPEHLYARVDDRVSEGLRQSEERQSDLVQARFADWSGRIDAQRRLDLARVAAGLSYLDGRQGQQLARTNELMGYVLEAAAREEDPR